MKHSYNVIKYIALGLGLLLSAVILAAVGQLVLGVAQGVNTLGFHWSGFGGASQEVISQDYSFSNIATLDLDCGTGKVEVTSGDSDAWTIKAENVSSEFTCTQTGAALKIKNPKPWWNFLSNLFSKDEKITIIAPKDAQLDEFELDCGVGSFTLDTLTVRALSLDAGTGKIEIQNLTVTGDTELDCGVGEVSIRASNMHNLKMDGGVGNFDYEGSLTGKSEISCGVGNTKLHLIGSMEDYYIDADSGVGTVRVGGEKIREHQTLGKSSAPHSLRIDGGVGNVEVSFR